MSCEDCAGCYLKKYPNDIECKVVVDLETQTLNFDYDNFEPPYRLGRAIADIAHVMLMELDHRSGRSVERVYGSRHVLITFDRFEGRGRRRTSHYLFKLTLSETSD
jgi:hypothetical protein